MRRRHTRSTDPTLATTVQKSIRLPEALVKRITSLIETGIPDIHTLTDATADALWLWCYEAEKVTPAKTRVLPPSPGTSSMVVLDEMRLGVGLAPLQLPIPPEQPTHKEEPMIEPKEDWDGDGIEVDHGPGKPFQGAGLHLPQDADTRRPSFDKVDIDSYVVD